jgi:hypothetical protein
MNIPSPFGDNRLWLAVRISHGLFLGVLVGPWWIKLKTEPLIYMERNSPNRRSIGKLHLTWMRVA